MGGHVQRTLVYYKTDVSGDKFVVRASNGGSVEEIWNNLKNIVYEGIGRFIPHKIVTKEAGYKQKIVRVQRLINIKFPKAYRTVSNEALCMITGLTPIDIKIEEFASLFQITKGRTKKQVALIMLIIALQFDVSTSFGM